MSDGRNRIARVLVTLGITALGGSILVASPTFAEPDIDTVQSKVDKLYHEAEQASERYNDARLEMKQAKTRLKALRASRSPRRSSPSTRARLSPPRPRCSSPRTRMRSSAS